MKSKELVTPSQLLHSSTKRSFQKENRLQIKLIPLGTWSRSSSPASLTQDTVSVCFSQTVNPAELSGHGRWLAQGPAATSSRGFKCTIHSHYRSCLQQLGQPRLRKTLIPYLFLVTFNLFLALCLYLPKLYALNQSSKMQQKFIK